MNIKLLYRLLAAVFIFIVIENNLFAQNDIVSSGNYSFFADANTSLIYKGGKPEEESSFLSSFNSWPRKKKTIALNAASVVATTAFGAASWDYYSSSFDFRDEGWFDPDTQYGGADKLGHTFGAYTLTSFYNNIYKRFGYSDEQAILRAIGRKPESGTENKINSFSNIGG